VWLRGQFRVENPVVGYRWLIDGVPNGYQWLNGQGVHTHDVTDAADFRVTTHPAPPAWAADAVLYQVFPDRFAKSVDRRAPEWAIPQAWDDPVIGAGSEAAFQYYGGAKLLWHWSRVSSYDRPEPWVRRVAIRPTVNAQSRANTGNIR
jgi:alpha-glucosidase